MGDAEGDLGKSSHISPTYLVSHDTLSSIKFNECPSNAIIALYLLDQLLYSTFHFCQRYHHG